MLQRSSAGEHRPNTPRTLPLRLPPLPGEALDSWLEALAHRLQATLGDLATAAELTIDRKHAPGRDPHSRGRAASPDWTVHLNDGEVASLAVLTAVPPSVIRDLTLARYHARALRIESRLRAVDRHTLWGRTNGSRFCPACLRDSGGRWQLSWRLGWAFACPIHRCLLADDCGGCGRLQRRAPPALTVVPRPGHCANAATGAVGTSAARCGFDLTQVPVLTFPPEHPVLQAQHLLWTCIDQGSADFGIYTRAPRPVADMLTDLRVLARKVLAEATHEELALVLPADLLTAYTQARTRPHSRSSPSATSVRPGFLTPARAALTAAAITTVLPALQIPDPAEAATALRWLLHPLRPRHTRARVTFASSPLTPILRDVLHAGNTQPSPPPRLGQSRSSDRATHVPTLLWPAWAIRLTPPKRHYAFTFPTAAHALSVVLARSTAGIDTVLTELGTWLPEHRISRTIRRLEDDTHWPAILTALHDLATHLDTHAAPIDYTRRRHLDYTHLLPHHVWTEICRTTHTVPGRDDRFSSARRWLFERLSGMPADLAPPPYTVQTHEDRARVSQFIPLLTPTLLAALDDHAHLFLTHQHIADEPITWHPTTALLEGLDLPGTDPSDVDISELHRLIRDENLRPRAAARRLATSTDAVRHLLTTHPAPSRDSRDLQTELAPEPGK